MPYNHIVMCFSRLIAVAVAAAALAALCAHEPTAPSEDLASSAGVGVQSSASTNDVADVVSTNGIVVTPPHQALIDAWRDIENVDDATPLKTVALPLSHYPEGNVRILFHAKEALLPKDEKAYLRAKDIYMEMFTPPAAGSQLEGIFLADNCIYDRVLRDGYCEGWVRLQYRNVKIVGTNMTWNLDTRKVKITGGSFVTIENGLMKGMGGMFKK
jgi:hypothetical protein